MPWEIYAACSNGDGIDTATYIALHSTIDLDGLYDLIEMGEVHASWKWAAALNAKEGSGRA